MFHKANNNMIAKVILFLILANNIFIQKSLQFYVPRAPVYKMLVPTDYGLHYNYGSRFSNIEFKSVQNNFGQRMLGNFFECPGCWIKCRTICTIPPVIGSVNTQCHDKCYAPCCGCTPTDPCING